MFWFFSFVCLLLIFFFSRGGVGLGLFFFFSQFDVGYFVGFFLDTGNFDENVP